MIPLKVDGARPGWVGPEGAAGAAHGRFVVDDRFPVELHREVTIDEGDVELVRALLVEMPSLASSLISWGPMLCPCKTEPLHYLSDASFNQLWNHGKQEELAAILIEAGAPVDGLPTSGETPLHGAASLGEAGVAEILIDHGANIEAVATYPGIPHDTPLDFAVHFGMVEVVDLLVRRGAKVLSTRMAAGAGQLDRMKAEWESLQEEQGDCAILGKMA